ncbi:unnamed protein product [Rotaria sordida]|uniref:Uncharacterized protein n=1 Tax=Rotaria sordida TaxID=392033 RepID=A0A819NAE8_9BILA|nr:unnamed protein product [Rotaria sordida]
MITNNVLLIDDCKLDRFCINILSKIALNIKSLIVESESTERILLAADYPNLVILKFFNFNNKIASKHFTVKSPFYKSCVLSSFHNLPLTAYSSSSTIYKLSICVNIIFENCIALLDGRIKQLTSFIVKITDENYQLSIVYNMEQASQLVKMFVISK